MNSARCSLVLVSLLIAVTAIGATPVAMDWHDGGRLYLLSATGDVVEYDPARRQTRTIVHGSSDFRAADIVSTSFGIFVSGFLGRTSAVVQYANDGKVIARYPTPELAAGMDVDPRKDSRTLYVASAVSSWIFAISLDQPNKTPRPIANIREGRRLGPVVFNEHHNTLIIGDLWNGQVYEVDCKRGSFLVVGGVSAIVSLAFDPIVNVLYVPDATTGIVHTFASRDPYKALARANSIPTDLHELTAIALGPNGGFYLADKKRGVLQYLPKSGLKPIM